MGILCTSSSYDVRCREVGGGRKGPWKLKVFDFRDLEIATGGFAADQLLGKGSHGCVYKATLKNGKQVAVKRLTFGRRRNQEEGAFDNELEILSQVRCNRLVNLIGYSDNSVEKLLVVEFMANGTLYDLLHGNPQPLSWPMRLHLALQIAKAVLALHSASPPVIHRDIKSQNVLIDCSFNAKLGDFGLALRGDIEEVMSKPTPPAGTMGYLDPGYESPSQLSAKIDVFSFGVLLLEMISGRQPIDVLYQPPRIVDWAVPIIKRGRSFEVCDPCVKSFAYIKSIRQLSALAARCVRKNSAKRPTMAQVVDGLKIINRGVSLPVWEGLSKLVRWRLCPRQTVQCTLKDVSVKSPRKFLRSIKVSDEPSAAAAAAESTNDGHAPATAPRTVRKIRFAPEVTYISPEASLLNSDTTPPKKLRRKSDHAPKTECRNSLAKVMLFVHGSSTAITKPRRGGMAHQRMKPELTSR